jgi:hypothetical protein
MMEPSSGRLRWGLWLALSVVVSASLFIHRSLCTKRALAHFTQRMSQQSATSTQLTSVVFFRTLYFTPSEASEWMEWARAEEAAGRKVMAFTSQSYDVYEEFRHTHQLAIPFDTLRQQWLWALAPKGKAAYTFLDGQWTPVDPVVLNKHSAP